MEEHPSLAKIFLACCCLFLFSSIQHTTPTATATASQQKKTTTCHGLRNKATTHTTHVTRHKNNSMSSLATKQSHHPADKAKHRADEAVPPMKRSRRKTSVLGTAALKWMNLNLAAVQLEQICSYVEDIRELSARRIQHWFAEHMKPEDPINRWVFKDCEVDSDHWSMSWRKAENYFDVRRNRDEWYRHQQSKPHHRRFYYNFEACEICAYEVAFLSNEDSSQFCWDYIDFESIYRAGDSMHLCTDCYTKHECGPCLYCHYEWLDDTIDCHDDMLIVNSNREDNEDEEHYFEDRSVDALGAIFCDRTCYDKYKQR